MMNLTRDYMSTHIKFDTTRVGFLSSKTLYRMQNLDISTYSDADIHTIHHLLVTDPGSQQLDQLWSDRHFHLDILTLLRREDFRSVDYGTVRRFIEKVTKRYYDKIVKQGFDVAVYRMIWNDDVTLQMRCFLICSPELVKALERSCDLVPTGDYYQFVETYRKRRMGLRISIPIKYGCGIEVIQNLIDKRSVVSWRSLVCAIRKRDDQLFDYLLSKYLSGGYSKGPKSLIYKSIKYGHRYALERLIEIKKISLGQLNPGILAEAIGSSKGDHVMNTLKEVIRILPETFDHRRCLKQAIKKGNVEVFIYLKALYPEDVAQHIKRWIRHVRITIRMFEAITTEGLEISPSFRFGSSTGVTIPELIAFATKYGHRISKATIYGLMEKSFKLLSYDLFDALLPHYLERLSPGCRSSRQLLYGVIQLDSRYMFDRLISHVEASLNKSQLADLSREVVASGSQIYFLERLGSQRHLEIVERAIIGKNDSAFEFSIAGQPEDYLQSVLYLTFKYGHHGYFSRLLLPQFQNPQDLRNIVCDRGNYVTRPMQVSVDIMLTISRFAPSLFVEMIMYYLDIFDIKICLSILSKVTDSEILVRLLVRILSSVETDSKLSALVEILKSSIISSAVLASAICAIDKSETLSTFSTRNINYIMTQLAHLDCVRGLDL